MSQHHGLKQYKGIEKFCGHDHDHVHDNRFGRLFDLPPLYVDPNTLKTIGAPNGPMDGGNTFKTMDLPVGYVFFGQFIDHDITLDVTSSLNENADESDIINARTPTLDLDCVYGLGPELQPFMYHADNQFKEVKLLTGADRTAATIVGGKGQIVRQPKDLADEDLARSSAGTAIIGDPRNDENRVISQLQLAMIRFHNNVVETVCKQHPELDRDELFERSRELTTWHYQWVVVHDFLKRLCGAEMIDDILACGRKVYCPPHNRPIIPIEFAVAAYRFGHSMIPQKITLRNNEHPLFSTIFGQGFSPLSRPDGIVDWENLLPVNGSTGYQKADRLDTTMASSLLALPFVDPGKENSLATRNLLRGQIFRLPSGEKVAKAVGVSDDDIEDVKKKVKDTLGSSISLQHGTPLWYYILAEAELFESGERLGEVGGRIVAETLIGILELDPRSWLGRNRNWTPGDSPVGVSDLGAMLTYQV